MPHPHSGNSPFSPQRIEIGPGGPGGSFGGPGGPTGNTGRTGRPADQGNNPFDPGFLQDLLGEEPRTSFFSRVNEQGGTGTAQGRFFNTQFDNFQNEFFGLLGSQIRSNICSGNNQIPNLSCEDFLGGINFDRRFRSTAPSLRGQGGQSRFRPPTRFRF